MAFGGVDCLRRVDYTGGCAKTQLAFAILFCFSETVIGLKESELSPGVVNSLPLCFRLADLYLCPWSLAFKTS